MLEEVGDDGGERLRPIGMHGVGGVVDDDDMAVG
jgi:hypothetical protein